MPADREHDLDVRHHVLGDGSVSAGLTENFYFDLVEMDTLAHEKYGWPAPGSDGSFHHAIQQGEHGQDTLAWIEMPDEGEDMEAYAEDYGEEQAKVIETLRKMVADGHLPDRPEYRILVWW